MTPDKSRQKIQAMFDEIAPTYDRLNHLFTLKLDSTWRRDIIRHITKQKINSEIILDLASGTGDLTIELLRLNPVEIIAADISNEMLAIQKNKIRDQRVKLINADSSSMPFEDMSFDIVTIGFGVRNFEFLEESLREIRRVLKPGGKLIVLEMFKSSGIWSRLFNIYFGKFIPFFGNKISGSRYAYSYLFKSVNNFYTPSEFIQICKNADFVLEGHINNFFGVVNTIYLKK